jgi:ribonuclease III
MSENASALPWKDPAWLEKVRRFSERLGLGAGHHDLMIRALTHRSLADVVPYGDNERLEFLGDSVLELVISDHLYRTFPDYNEGQLTKLKVRYVSEPSLVEAAAALDLGSLLAMVPGEEASGGRERPSTLSDAFEAVLAALYLARGLDAAREFLVAELIGRVDPTIILDHKSRLQETVQERSKLTPSYRTVAESGPSHEPVFFSEVSAGAEVLGTGTGKSKKVAEQAAALDALARLEKPKRPRKKTAATPG